MSTQPLRICLDISAGLAQGAGIGRYARELAIALDELQGGPDLTLFHNRQPLDKLPASLSRLSRVVIPLNNKLWRALVLTGARLPEMWGNAIAHCDLFHGTDSLVPRIKLPTVLTIHDLSTTLYPQHHTLLHRMYARVSLPGMARDAAAVITDSVATRLDLIEHLHLPPDKVHVIYLGVDHGLFYPRNHVHAQQEVLQSLNIKPPYILAVGTLEPRKNLASFLRAYASLPADRPHAVLVGARGWGESPLFNLVKELGLEESVHFTGYVADTMLPTLYSGAEFFVYPSIYEGFGLPILEAMACGAPVITSNVSSMPEVTGDAGLLVDPMSIDSIKLAMQELLVNNDLKTTLRTAGPLRAAQFTWERTARQTIEVYQGIQSNEHHL